MRAELPFSNFSRGQLDADMDGRFDLPVYRNGLRVCQNMITNFKGNARYRSAFENLVAFQDCAFVEFRFSQNQNYLLILYANKMRFMSYDVNDNFGFVLNPGPTIFEVDTPWTLAESKEIAFRKAYTQNFDSMIICHEDHPPYELKRIAADDFTLNPISLKDDPFVLTNDAGKTITGITKTVEPTVTIAAHGYVIGDRLTITGVNGMTDINDYTVGVVSVPTVNTVTISLDTTDFSTYTSAGSAAKAATASYPAVSLYYKGRLYFGQGRLKITTIWASEAGQFFIFTLPTTVTADSALEFTLAEMTSRIEWLFAGQNSLIVGSNDLIVAVNGGGVREPITAETIDTIPTSADGTNNVAPLTKDSLVFYVGNSNDGRNLFYFSYDLLTETFVAPDANLLAYDITEGGMTKIRYVKTREDLIFALRGDGDLLSCNFRAKQQAEGVIGWHVHPTEGAFQDIAQISDNNGQQQLFVLTLRDSVYYIERQEEYVEFSKRRSDDFFTNDKPTDDEAFDRKIAEELKECRYLDNSSTFSDLRDTAITYDSGAGTVTDAGAGFVSGDVGKHIVYKTATGYESGRFEITVFNSTSEVDVDVLQTPTTNTFSDWYLTFDTLTGLSRFDGKTVGVVGDGGFLSTFVPSSGTVALEQQVTTATVGYIYRGVISSFTLGFQAGAENTQTTMKALNRIGIRANNTAGGKFGTTPYRLEPIQELKQGDLNYLPPPPINGTKFVTYVDDHEFEKEWYLVQDEPLPMTVTSVIVDGDYAITR